MSMCYVWHMLVLTDKTHNNPFMIFVRVKWWYSDVEGFYVLIGCAIDSPPVLGEVLMITYGDLICDKNTLFQPCLLSKKEAQFTLPDMNPLKICKIIGRVFKTIDTFPLFELGQQLFVYDIDMLSMLIHVHYFMMIKMHSTITMGTYFCYFWPKTVYDMAVNIVAIINIYRYLITVIVLFFGNQISKWRSFEKRTIFDLLFTFFSHQGKVTKIPSAHISLTYIHVFCSPPLTFFALPILKKKKRIYQIRFLFGMNPGVDSYSRHFGTINK